jgi:hypothetical protein
MSWAKRRIGVKSDAGFTANTRFLTRIIAYLSYVETGVGITRLSKEIVGDANQVRDAVHWLVNNKVLIVETIGSREIYFINPKWAKLKANKIGEIEQKP